MKPTFRSLLPVRRSVTTPTLFDRVFTDLDQVFNDFVGRGWNAGAGEELGTWRPAVDVYETDEAIHFSVDLPGLSKDDVSVSLENQVVTVSGERAWEWPQDAEGYRRAERFHGKFTRSFSLPQGADIDKVSARFENGVLHLEIPKGEHLRARRIEIK